MILRCLLLLFAAAASIHTAGATSEDGRSGPASTVSSLSTAVFPARPAEGEPSALLQECPRNGCATRNERPCRTRLAAQCSIGWQIPARVSGVDPTESHLMPWRDLDFPDNSTLRHYRTGESHGAYLFAFDSLEQTGSWGSPRSGTFRVDQESCADAIVMRVYASHHLAQVACRSQPGDPAHTVFLSLDRLQCQPSHVTPLNALASVTANQACPVQAEGSPDGGASAAIGRVVNDVLPVSQNVQADIGRQLAETAAGVAREKDMQNANDVRLIINQFGREAMRSEESGDENTNGCCAENAEREDSALHPRIHAACARTMFSMYQRSWARLQRAISFTTSRCGANCTNCTGNDPQDIVESQRICRTLNASRRMLANDMLDVHRQGSVNFDTSFRSVIDPADSSIGGPAWPGTARDQEIFATRLCEGQRRRIQLQQLRHASGSRTNQIDLIVRTIMFYGLSCQGQASLVSNQGELSCGGGERLSRPTQTTGRGLAALGPSTTPATGTVLHNARPALELGRYDARAGGDVGLMINGSLPQLHAGYVYGGSRIAHDGGGADCSDFVSRVLRASSVVQSPSTLTVGDFENIYHHLRDEPALPLTVQQQRYAHCFVPINLNVSGNAPLPGDLVGMRRSFQGIISDARARGALEAAHIVMVRDFDASTGSISTIEAAGGEVGGLTTELSRPLYDPECPGSGAPLNTRSPRPDIFVLRPQEDCFRAAAR